MSDIEDETVELRRKRDAGDPPSPITLIPHPRKQSHLPSISEIHHLRLSLNEKLMHANSNSNQHTTPTTASATRSAKPPPFVTAPSSPVSASAARKLVPVSSPPSMMTNNRGTATGTEQKQQEYNDLHLFLIREHYKSQKSFVHSNHENEMRRVQELREVKQQLISSNGTSQPSSSTKDVESSAAFFKRNSFLRNSWNVIMRQSVRLSVHGGQRSSWESGGSGNGRKSGGGGSKTGSASGSAENNGIGTPSNSKCSSDSEFFGNRFSFQSLRKRATGKAALGGSAKGSGGGHKRNSSTSSFFSNR